MSRLSDDSRLEEALSAIRFRWKLRDSIHTLLIVFSFWSMGALLGTVINAERIPVVMTALGAAAAFGLGERFKRSSRKDAARYLDAALGSKERSISAIELEKADPRNTLLRNQLNALIAGNTGILPAVRVPKTLVTAAALGVACLAIIPWIPDRPLPESTRFAVTQLDILLETETPLPPEARESLETLRDALTRNELTSDEVSSALERAAAEIEQARSELKNAEGSLKEERDVPAVATATPTPAPGSTPPVRMDTQVQHSKSDSEKGEEKATKQEDNDSGSSKQGGEPDQGKKDSKNGGEGSSSQEGKQKGDSKNGGDASPESSGSGGGRQGNSQGEQKGSRDQNEKGQQGDKEKQQGETGRQGGTQAGEKENQPGSANSKQSGNEGEKESEQSKALKAASNTVNAIRAQQQQKSHEGQQNQPESGKRPGNGKGAAQRGSSGEKRGDRSGERAGEKEETGAQKGSDRPQQKPERPESETERAKPSGGSGGQGEAKEFVPGQGTISSPFGGSKQLEETRVGRSDERFDTRYTGKESELAKNPNDARPKTKLSDVMIARPELLKEREEQPIPLEYRDVLE